MNLRLVIQKFLVKLFFKKLQKTPLFWKEAERKNTASSVFVKGFVSLKLFEKSFTKNFYNLKAVLQDGF